MLNPHTTKLIAGEHRRDLMAARRQSVAPQFTAEPRPAQQLTQRLRLSLRAITRPRPAAHA